MAIRRTTRARDAGDGLEQPRPRASSIDDAVTALLSLWLISGLMLDAWAHANKPGLETFFTPWHAVFYSGFAATAAWVLRLVFRHRSDGRAGLAAIPIGYGPTLVALAVFALSGLADMVWHTVFGIEDSIDILFSPSHLGLAISMFVIVTTPVRAAWSDPAPATLRRLWPALLGTGLAVAEVMVFLEYGNAMLMRATWIVTSFSEGGDDGSASRLAVRMVVTNATLLLPLLFLARRWGLPPGAALLTTTPLLILSGAETGGRNLSTLLSVLVAALGVELFARALRPTAERRRAYWLFAGLAPFFTWSLYLGVAASAVGRLPTVVELWTGAPIVAAAVGWLLGVLMLPAAPAATPR
ncbi:hypothetical protein [Nocardia sp. NPDC050710]|uniref:hypothetical protein n=1 Tax=Nocardia sp. NPDC050710 TaxID=3157220 RepID=UPI0033FA863A